ncbi:MAG: bifunctional 2-C-methyl-D-erythritol 4-phosphate cytidylyltransferase/2-C-methyl-D-erythritol 2,4-cyclodiphosphate synthase [Boseongicola sp.]
MKGEFPDKSLAAAVIVAAGRGTRAGGAIPKQWQPLAGRRVIDWTIDAFRNNPKIGPIVVVLHEDDYEFLNDPGLILAPGGETRAASVRAGLEALEGTAVENVLIHDAARVSVANETITNVVRMLGQHNAVAPGLPVSDALWVRDTENKISGLRDRKGVYRAQTPQGFRFDAILAAHRQLRQDAADDVEVARAAGIEVAIAPGDPDNLKITLADDFVRAERILKSRINTGMNIRLGNGFDVHRFGPGDHVTLCGVSVPHDRGLQGHSDADVGMHAITDAIYGALAEGDIGQHFPPTDAKWKDAASEIFLKHAIELAGTRGFLVGNVDCTLICETPKIAPFAAEMRERLAEVMKIPTEKVSVKATTSERLGFTGRREGIAAIATATLVPA